MAYRDVTSSPTELLYAASIKNTAPFLCFMYSVHCATSDGIFFDALICKHVSRGKDDLSDVLTCATLCQECQLRSTLLPTPHTLHVCRGRGLQRQCPTLAYIERYPCFRYHRKVNGVDYPHDHKRFFRKLSSMSKVSRMWDDLVSPVEWQGEGLRIPGQHPALHSETRS